MFSVKSVHPILAAVAGAIAGRATRQLLDAYEFETPPVEDNDPFLVMIQHQVRDDLVVAYGLVVKVVKADAKDDESTFRIRWLGHSDTRIGLARILLMNAERPFRRRY